MDEGREENEAGRDMKYRRERRVKGKRGEMKEIRSNEKWTKEKKALEED